jgi:hypothetical protein
MLGIEQKKASSIAIFLSWVTMIYSTAKDAWGFFIFIFYRRRLQSGYLEPGSLSAILRKLRFV